MDKRILVVGATGMLGQPVTRKLHQDGFKVRVMTRDTEKGAEIFGAGFEIAHGDVLNEESVYKALAHCFAVYINLAGESEWPGMQNIVNAAKKQNVKRIAYISGATVSQQNRWFATIDRKYRAEQAIMESGIDYHIFRSSWFFESLPAFVRNGKVFLIGKQEKPYHWIAAADYARMVSNAFQSDNARNKIFYTFGPEIMSLQQALERYCQLAHPQIKKVKPIPFFVAQIMKRIIRKEEFNNVVELLKYFSKTGETGNPMETDKILGKAEINLAQWYQQQKNEKDH